MKRFPRVRRERAEFRIHQRVSAIRDIVRPLGRRRLHDSEHAQLLAQGFNMTHTDVEAGIKAGFVNFNGGLPDVHMFKIWNGKIKMITSWQRQQRVVVCVSPITNAPS